MKARNHNKPLALRNAPMEYAPMNELGVVFLFAHVARRLHFRIEEIRPAFPDCIAFRRCGDTEKRVRIEFEYRSSAFKTHRHDAKQCDIIVCWHHDWPDAPRRLEIIELKRYFGVARKVWIQQAIRNQWENMDAHNRMWWALSKKATPGDILLMYRCTPICAITDIFIYKGQQLYRGRTGWREGGEAYFGEIQRLCHLASPVFLSDLRSHKVIRTAPFMRRNLQGVGLQATEYWPYLYEMIIERNPAAARVLRKFRPDV